MGNVMAQKHRHYHAQLGPPSKRGEIKGLVVFDTSYLSNLAAI